MLGDDLDETLPASANETKEALPPKLFEIETPKAKLFETSNQKLLQTQKSKQIRTPNPRTVVEGSKRMYQSNLTPGSKNLTPTNKVKSDDKFSWERNVISKVKLVSNYYVCVDCGFKSSESHGWGGQKQILIHINSNHLSRFRSVACLSCDHQSESLLSSLDHMMLVHKMKPNLKVKRKMLQPSPSQKRKVIEIQIEDDIESERVKNDVNPKEEMLAKKQKLEEKLVQLQESLPPFNWHEEMLKKVEKIGKRFKCLECRCCLGGPKRTVTHMEQKHFKEFSHFKCPECFMICDQISNFISHMNIQHRINLKLSKDDIHLGEKASFNTINSSIIHMSKSKPNGFSWQKMIINNVKLSGDYYLCHDCGFKVRRDNPESGADIMNHVEDQHLNIQGFKCKDCGYKVKHFNEFSRHLKTIHLINLNVVNIQNFYNEI